MEEQRVPPPIAEHVDYLEGRFGVRPTVTRVDMATWRIEVTNPTGSVRWWTDWRRPVGSKRWQAPKRNHMSIDGVPADARTMRPEQLLSLFGGEGPAAAEPWPIPTDRPASELTGPAKSIFQQFFRNPAVRDVVRAGGNADGTEWMVGLDANGVSVRWRFFYRRDGVPARKTAKMQVLVDGVNCTYEFANDVQKLLAMMGGEPGTPGESRGARAESAAAVNTSVNVRRQSVMRV